MRHFSLPPEFYRISRGSLRPGRVLFSVAASSAISICILLVNLHKRTPSWTDGAKTLIALQALILIVYGTTCTFSSILGEKVDGTWDFLRLTPMNVYQVSLGKLLAAPLLAYVMSLTIILWAFFAVFRSAAPLGQVGGWLLASLAGAFFAHSLGLLCSAEIRRGEDQALNSSSAAIGAVVGCLVYFGGFTLLNPPLSHPFLYYYGIEFEPWLLETLFAAAFGAWAFAAASWRIGRDFSEPRKFWRFPAFILFWAVVLAGFGHGGNDVFYFADVALLAIPVYVAALTDPERRESWKRWSVPARGRLTRAWLDLCPAWGLGFVTLGVATPLLMGIEYLRGPLAPLDGALGDVKMLVLIARDLLFIQACQLATVRKSNWIATSSVVFAYALPTMLGAEGSRAWLRVLFTPSGEPDLRGFLGLFCCGLQLCAVAYALVLHAKRQRRAIKIALAEV